MLENFQNRSEDSSSEDRSQDESHDHESRLKKAAERGWNFLGEHKVSEDGETVHRAELTRDGRTVQITGNDKEHLLSELEANEAGYARSPLGSNLSFVSNQPFEVPTTKAQRLEDKPQTVAPPQSDDEEHPLEGEVVKVIDGSGEVVTDTRETREGDKR